MSRQTMLRERTQDRRIVPALVRVVVVTVVAAMLPGCIFALMRAREQSRRASCLNNVKMIGLAMKQYSQDFRDCYPWCCGVLDPEEAWVDLGVLYPNYNSAWKSFLCPSADDVLFEPKCESGDMRHHPLEPLKPADNKEVISYAYGYDSSENKITAWTEEARATVRLLADKKAGIEITEDLMRFSAHKDDGRNVLYNDGHVRWKPGSLAIDPDEDNDKIGAPDAEDYKKWWSDPPWYGEGMEDEEAAEEPEE